MCRNVHEKKRLRRWIGLLAAAVVAAACSESAFVQDTGSPSASPLPVTTSATPEDDCRRDPAQRPLPDVTSLLGQPNLITDYLNSGGDVESLLEALRQAGGLPVDPQALDAAQMDLDGDGREDLAVSLQEPEGGASPRPPGSLLVWLCRQGEYSLVHQSEAETEHSAPLILAAVDLTEDDAAELVFGRPVCGAHTCFLAIGILQWDDGGFIDIWRGTSEDLPTPVVSIMPPTSSDPATVSVTSAGVQSVGAGPPRSRTRLWAWSSADGAFMPAADTLSPPVFRIHVVHDADRAFLAGDFASAAGLYEMALEDEDLADWVSEPATPASLGAYVRYRIALNALALSDLEKAEAALDTMADALTGIPEAQAYLAMTQRLLTFFRQNSDLGLACASVREFAAAHRPGVVDPLYYGYDNPEYTTDDLCPVR